jgi:uncharacterized membrane protein HdeD (DUF308 family)
MKARLPADESRWARGLLGVALLVAGAFVLGDVVLMKTISAILIGFAAIAGGLFEILHAFWTKGWGGRARRIHLGILYLVVGAAIASRPTFSAAFLTLYAALALIISGLLRIPLGRQFRDGFGWLLMVSGVFGIAAGCVMILKWPFSGPKAIGFLLGGDLILHGAAWLAIAWKRAPVPVSSGSTPT